MYPAIQSFLKEKGCERVLIEGVNFDYIKRWIIDVAGIKEARVYAVEAKPKLSFDSFSAALTQARYYKQASTHVYVCLPEPISDKENELLQHIRKICDQEKIGLLLFTSQKGIQEVKDAEESRPDLDKYFYVMQQLTSETLSDKIQGARAFIVRDLCYYLVKQFQGRTLESNIRSYFFSKKSKSDAYWRKAYINPRTKADRTLDATIICAEELGLIERVKYGNEVFMHVTNFGKDLVGILDVSKIGEKELSKQVASFFHALSQRCLEVRTTVQILKDFKRKMLFGTNECSKGHKFWSGQAVIKEGKIYCPKCGEELSLRSENTSLLCRLILKLHYDPYHQLVFWLNSEVLPIKSISKNKFVEYIPT
jgi:hypothetical protein